MHPVWIGCSGWSYDDWADRLYRDTPRRAWLQRYAERFSTVEVNASFYRLPRRETVETWANAVPTEFRFAVKVSRYLTHIRRLRDIADGLATLRERLEPFAERGVQGPLLWQLPPDMQRNDARLAGALDALDGGQHAFEFRHASWFCEPVAEALGERNAAFVVADDARTDLPQAPRTADWSYARLHYGRGRRGGYRNDQLDTWRRRIAAWRSDGEVYAYLNNDWEGFAVRNATTVAEGLRATG